jgi:DNA helicase-2/ATP-dependent DNA helicase PcrA
MAAPGKQELFSGPEPDETGDGRKRKKRRKRQKRAKSPTPPRATATLPADVPTDVLADVTDAQRLAIEHETGPMLVLAGAGSGKTRVITRRIARLVQKGVPPWAILSITFTNKAAGEMAERVRALVGSSRVWVSTFHSFCARLLRQDIVKLDYPREFTIYDQEDSEKCLKEVLAAAGALDTVRPRQALSQVGRWKSALVGPDQAYAVSSGQGEWRKRVIAEAFRVYEKRLRDCNALDFDDLLLKSLELLRVHSDVREKWTRRFHHLQVDEYQDTNRIQYELVKILAGDRRNMVVVGDPNQSIYSWRGAEPRNIRDFCDDFKDARIVKLGTNFRSKQAILDAAGALMSPSGGPDAGPLQGVRGEGGRPNVLVTADEAHEAAEICRRIDERVRAGRPAREFAVFYRTNAQSRAFEQAFMQRGVPFAVIGAVAFYQRREVKDALAYLRVAVNRSDDVGFRRIVNTPRRGIGDKAVAKLADITSARGMSLADAARDPSMREHAGPRAARSLGALDALLGRLAELARGPAGPAVRAAAEATGLRKFYEDSGEDERVENLDELVNAAFGYDGIHAEVGAEPGLETEDEPPARAGPSGLGGFLEEAALVSDFDRWDDTRERVALMTLHSAKGLEFPCVYIAGLEDGLLPHIRVINEGDERAFEEERRLLYVGMTRAKDELTLSYARSRARGGTGSLRVRSRFLKDMPRRTLDVENLTGDGEDAAFATGETWESRARPGASRTLKGRRFGKRLRQDDFPVEDVPRDEASVAEQRAIRKALEAADEDEPVYDFEVGMRVRHSKYGVGKVASIKGYGRKAKVTIDFPRVGRKTLALGFARLSRA